MPRLSAGQSQSMMLRRLILFALLTLLATSITRAEPVYRVAYVNAIASSCNDNAKNSPGGCNNLVTTDSNNNNSVNEDNLRSEETGVQNVTDVQAVEEGRGKKKKGYGKMMFMMAGLMKASMLYLMIHAVAALAGKALIVAKVALAIATAVGLKKALEHNDKTSYEIVKHPHHSYVQTHSTSVDYDHHHGGYEGGHRRRRRRVR